MGYRNNPIYMCTTKSKFGSLGYDFHLSVDKISGDYRHSAPLLREILFEFLQGKYITGSLKDHLYFGGQDCYVYKTEKYTQTICRVSDNYLCSEYFLDAWSNYYFVDVFDCEHYDECCEETKICTIFPSTNEHDWDAIYSDKCFFYCSAREEKHIRQLEDITKRVMKAASRELLPSDYEYGEWDGITIESEEACNTPDVDEQIGLNIRDYQHFSCQPGFDKYPLYLFANENGLSVATSPDCQYAALNRLLDGGVYRGLSEHFDVSLELDTVSEAVFEFAGETDRCYRDGNSLIIRQMDDCMFSDFLRTYTIDTLFYPKGAWGEKKENPLFKLSFSPMGLNANLIANFEIYDKSVVDIIKSVMTDIAEKYKRALYFDVKPPLAKMPEAVKNNPREHLDVILNGKCGTKLKGKEKRLKKEHDRIMKFRNGESLPPSISERIRAFLTK